MFRILFENLASIRYQVLLPIISWLFCFYQPYPMKMRLKAARFLQQKSLDCSFQTKTKPLQGSKAFSALSLCPGYICNNGGGTRAMEWKINTMPSIAYIYHILYVNICWCWICHKSQNLRKWLYVGLVSAVIFFSFMFVSFSIKPSLGF